MPAPSAPTPQTGSPAPTPPAPAPSPWPYSGPPHFDLPEVSPQGYEYGDVDSPSIVVTPSRVEVDHQSIVSLIDGAVDPSSSEGGVRGRRIPKLTSYLAKVRARNPNPIIQLAIDRRAPYRLLMEVMASATHRAAGYRSFQISARDYAKLLLLPVSLLEERPSAGASAVRMVVAITEQRILVWSLSGLEGKQDRPKAVVQRRTDIAELTRVLAEIVQRRWSGKPRPAADRGIILMAHPDTPMQLIVEVLGAMRVTPNGTELFPEVALSAGFE